MMRLVALPLVIDKSKTSRGPAVELNAGSGCKPTMDKYYLRENYLVHSPLNARNSTLLAY